MFYYFASRCGFTIAIWPQPFVYIYTSCARFCFSLGFYHCHFPIAIGIYTPSFAPTTIHWPIIVLLAGVLPLPFYHCILHRYTFIYWADAWVGLVKHPKSEYPNGNGKTPARSKIMGQWKVEGVHESGCECIWNCIYTKGKGKMAMVKPQREAKEWESGW